MHSKESIIKRVQFKHKYMLCTFAMLTELYLRFLPSLPRRNIMYASLSPPPLQTAGGGDIIKELIGHCFATNIKRTTLGSNKEEDLTVVICWGATKRINSLRS